MAVADVVANTEPVSEHPDQVVVAKPRRSGWVLAIAIVGFVLITLVLALVLVYLYAVLGPTALLYAGLLASLPLVVVLLGIRWVDRWEPEPRIVLLFAFFWGAAASVFIALVFSGITQSYLASRGLQKSSAADFFETVVQAPIVEETAKGLGVLLLFWVMRKYFDGPVDGIVYGATVGIGFAFTENVQYFGLAIIQDHGFGQGVGETFLLRAVLSPFAHVMFTSVTGLALGIAARESNRIGAIGYFLLGLVPAIFLHGFWNSAGYWATNWYLYYFFIQVPLFVIAIVAVVRLRRHEQVITHERLSEYAGGGLVHPERGEPDLHRRGAKTGARLGGPLPAEARISPLPAGRNTPRFHPSAPHLGQGRDRRPPLRGRSARGDRGGPRQARGAAAVADGAAGSVGIPSAVMGPRFPLLK